MSPKHKHSLDLSDRVDPDMKFPGKNCPRICFSCSCGYYVLYTEKVVQSRF